MKIGQILEIKRRKYRLTSLLGSGLTADVFLAEAASEVEAEITSLPKYAVKVLREGARPEVRDRFLGEVMTLTQLRAGERGLYEIEKEAASSDSYHTPDVIEDATQNAEPYFVMELIDGESVVERIVTGEPYKEAEGLAIIQQLTWLLAVLHRMMNKTAKDLQLRDLYWYREERLLKVIDWNVVSTASSAAVNPGRDLAKAVSFLLQLLTGKALRGDAAELDQRGVRRVELEQHPGWEEISPASQELIARALHPAAEKRLKTAMELHQALVERLRDWETDPHELLRRGEELINNLRKMEGQGKIDRAKMVEASTQARNDAFIASKKGLAESVDTRYVGYYAQELLQRAKGVLGAAKIFFDLSNYNEADALIDEAIVAGWGLEAWRWKQATRLGVTLQDALTKATRDILIEGLEEMQKRHWVNAASQFGKVAQAIPADEALSNLYAETQAWQRLEEVRRVDDALSADDPQITANLEKAAEQVLSVQQVASQISDREYQSELLAEIGDLEKQANAYRVRGKQWQIFQEHYKQLMDALRAGQISQAVEKLGQLAPSAEEAAMQEQALRLCLEEGNRLIEQNNLAVARQFLEAALLAPFQKHEILKNIRTRYEITRLPILLEEGKIEAAREVTRKVKGELSPEETARFSSSLRTQAMRKAPSLPPRQQEMLFELLVSDLSVNETEQREAQARLEALRRVRLLEVQSWYADIVQQVESLRRKGGSGNLIQAETLLQTSIESSRAFQTDHHSQMERLLEMVQKERQRLELRSVQAEESSKFAGSLVELEKKAKGCDSEKDLTGLLVEVKREQEVLEKSGKDWDTAEDFRVRLQLLREDIERWLKNLASKIEALAEPETRLDALEQLAWAGLETGFVAKVLGQVWQKVTSSDLPPGNEKVSLVRKRVQDWAARYEIDLPEAQWEVERRKKHGARRLLQSHPKTLDEALSLAREIEQLTQNGTLKEEWANSPLARQLDELHNPQIGKYLSLGQQTEIKRLLRNVPLAGVLFAEKEGQKKAMLRQVLAIGVLARRLQPNKLSERLTLVGSEELRNPPMAFRNAEQLHRWIDRLARSDMPLEEILQAYDRAAQRGVISAAKQKGSLQGVAATLAIGLLILVFYIGGREIGPLLVSILIKTPPAVSTLTEQTETPTLDQIAVAATQTAAAAATQTSIAIATPTATAPTPFDCKTTQPIMDIPPAFSSDDPRWGEQSYTTEEKIGDNYVPYRVFIGSLPEAIKIQLSPEQFADDAGLCVRVDTTPDERVMLESKGNGLWQVNGLTELGLNDGSHDFEFVFKDKNSGQARSTKLVVVWNLTNQVARIAPYTLIQVRSEDKRPEDNLDTTDDDESNSNLIKSFDVSNAPLTVEITGKNQAENWIKVLVPGELDKNEQVVSGWCSTSSLIVITNADFKKALLDLGWTEENIDLKALLKFLPVVTP